MCILITLMLMMPEEKLAAQNCMGRSSAIGMDCFADSRTTQLLIDTAGNAGEFRPTKSPVAAALMSAALPGLGQFYTKSYWKIPIIFGMAGYFIYEWFQNDKRYRDYGDQYINSVALAPPSGYQQLRDIREFYRDQRDAFVWYMGLLYFVNILDAYVDAHLYDFEVGESLSVQIRPMSLEKIMLVKVRL